jgi:benzoylformate decarboxylase
VRIFEGTGGEAFAEQLIASGVKYVFGNPGSKDSFFYDALVDRPQLTYILTPHEGPGAAMATGYVQASLQPALVMQAAAVGLVDAMGQMFNAWKEQTPLVFYSYRNESSRSSGRDSFEEVLYQEQLVDPLTKWHWRARRPEMIPETLRRSFKVAWTPPYGPTYATWHSDYLGKETRTEIIAHEKVDPRLRVRPNPKEVERAARVLVESDQPLMFVGDELYKVNGVDKAVRLAEMLGMPVTQPWQVFANFPQTHPFWVPGLPDPPASLRAFAQNPDVIINVGNKLQLSASLVPTGTKFIDMRIDSSGMGNVIPTEVPLVADVAYGLEDLMEAVQNIMTPSIQKRVQERSERVRRATERFRRLRDVMMKSPDWDRSPLLSDRLTYEIARFADENAIIVDEAGSIGGKHFFDFNPLGGRELFSFHGGHLGSGVGRSAGIKLARPTQQVICLVGDGAFLFGPTALWNMARLGLGVIVVVYNNHAYGGIHNRAIAEVPGGRMVQTGHFVCDYLGNPDINMVDIARGFGVKGETVHSPQQLKPALAQAQRTAQEGKPYLIDAQVARTGVGWREAPWTPTVSLSEVKG